MTTDLQNAVSRLFPYESVALENRIGEAQEIIGMTLRLIDRFRVRPDYEFDGVETTLLDTYIARCDSVYGDQDVWLSWRDLLSQCLSEAASRSERLYAFAAHVNSCATEPIGRLPGEPFSWLRCGSGCGLPDGIVDPNVLDRMTPRWSKNAQSVVWEDSGHQPSTAIKRVIKRVVDSCEGVILRFGSTYFNPNLNANCSVVGCGTEGSRIAELQCTVSDGTQTVRGILRTTAETPAEQAAALSFVKQELRERALEAGFKVDM